MTGLYAFLFQRCRQPGSVEADAAAHGDRAASLGGGNCLIQTFAPGILTDLAGFGGFSGLSEVVNVIDDVLVQRTEYEYVHGDSFLWAAWLGKGRMQCFLLLYTGL